jgi:ankyrin repeat protein
MANNDADVLGSRLWDICFDRENATSIAAMRSLIDKGANVNTKNEHGRSVLMNAIFNGYLNAVEMLLVAEGIDIRTKDNGQGTVLMYACSGGNIEIVKALLAALKKTPNFDINDIFKGGSTALMFACVHGNVEVTKLFFSIPRINTHLKDSGGKTALDFAKGKANEDEIRALFQGEFLPSQIQMKRNQFMRFLLLLTLSPSLYSRCLTAHSF